MRKTVRIRILLCIAFVAIVPSYLPNKWDGLYLTNETYAYGVNNIISTLEVTLFVNFCLFGTEILRWFEKVILKKPCVETSKIPRYKFCVLLICVAFFLLSFASVGYVTAEDDRLIIKTSAFSDSKTVTYTELAEYDLFVANDNDVYWGETTNGSSTHYYHDIYLGKLENNDRLINQIREKSGRALVIGA
ncbi:MAG: hypothetical protein IKK70_06670 [Clostridia bacterium]|nr:hypothetical protein [Clostridia bacterium]